MGIFLLFTKYFDAKFSSISLEINPVFSEPHLNQGICNSLIINNSWGLHRQIKATAYFRLK